VQVSTIAELIDVSNEPSLCEMFDRGICDFFKKSLHKHIPLDDFEGTGIKGRNCFRELPSNTKRVVHMGEK
jgi:hypothetical protein